MLTSTRTCLKEGMSPVELVRGKYSLDCLQSTCGNITSWKCLMDLQSNFYLIIHIKQRAYILPQLMKEQKLAHKHTLFMVVLMP